MRQPAAPQRFRGEQDYARVENIILDLQLSISSVSRANGCLDLPTVQQIRASASHTLDSSDLSTRSVRPDPLQARRLAERRQALANLLRKPAPIENLARTLHLG